MLADFVFTIVLLHFLRFCIKTCRNCCLHSACVLLLFWLNCPGFSREASSECLLSSVFSDFCSKEVMALPRPSATLEEIKNYNARLMQHFKNTGYDLDDKVNLHPLWGGPEVVGRPYVNESRLADMCTFMNNCPCQIQYDTRYAQVLFDMHFTEDGLVQTRNTPPEGASYCEYLYRLSKHFSQLLRHAQTRGTNAVRRDLGNFVSLQEVSVHTQRDIKPKDIASMLFHNTKSRFQMHVVLTTVDQKMKFPPSHLCAGDIHTAGRNMMAPIQFRTENGYKCAYALFYLRSIQGTSVPGVETEAKYRVTPGDETSLRQLDEFYPIPHCGYALPFHGTTVQNARAIIGEGWMRPGGNRTSRNETHFALQTPADTDVEVSGVRDRKSVWIFVDHRKCVLEDLIEFKVTANNVFTTPTWINAQRLTFVDMRNGTFLDTDRQLTQPYLNIFEAEMARRLAETDTQSLEARATSLRSSILGPASSITGRNIRRAPASTSITRPRAPPVPRSYRGTPPNVPSQSLVSATNRLPTQSLGEPDQEPTRQAPSIDAQQTSYWVRQYSTELTEMSDLPTVLAEPQVNNLEQTDQAEPETEDVPMPSVEEPSGVPPQEVVVTTGAAQSSAPAGSDRPYDVPMPSVEEAELASEEPMAKRRSTEEPGDYSMDSTSSNQNTAPSAEALPTPKFLTTQPAFEERVQTIAYTPDIAAVIEETVDFGDVSDSDDTERITIGEVEQILNVAGTEEEMNAAAERVPVPRATGEPLVVNEVPHHRGRN